MLVSSGYPMVMNPTRARLAIVAMMLCLVTAPSLQAQSVPDSLIGRRVRLFLTEQPRDVEDSPQVIRGTVLESTSDTIRLRLHPSTGPVSIASASIERLDLSGGVRTRLESAVHEASRAALWMAIYSVLLNETSNDPMFSRWQAAVVGAAGGVVFGGVTGAVYPRERWRRVGWP